MALPPKREFSAKNLTPAVFLCNPTLAEQTTKKEKRTKKKKKKLEKEKKSPLPSPTHTQMTVPNRGAIHGCSEMGHKEKCLQIKPTFFFFLFLPLFFFK